MKVLVKCVVRCNHTVEVPDGLEGDALTDAVSNALPPICAGWDDWDVDEEENIILPPEPK